MKTHRNRVRFAAAAAALLCTGVMPAGAFVPVESSGFCSDSYAAYASAGHTGWRKAVLPNGLLTFRRILCVMWRYPAAR